MKKEVVVEGMTCEGCANTVRERFKAIKGVKAVEIDVPSKKVTLTSSVNIERDELESSLADTHYSLGA